MGHMKKAKKNCKLNKLVILTIIVCIMAVISVNCIYAYYTNKDEKVNKFKVGNIEVTITEPNYKENSVIKPEGSIVKDPTLSSTGTVSAYIRAQV